MLNLTHNLYKYLDTFFVLLKVSPFICVTVVLFLSSDIFSASSMNLLAPLKMNIGWPAVIGAVVAYYGTLVFYRLFLHPLSRFPGPKLAAISRWYEAYYDVVLGGQYTVKIAELHRKYGRYTLSSDIPKS